MGDTTAGRSSSHSTSTVPTKPPLPDVHHPGRVARGGADQHPLAEEIAAEPDGRAGQVDLLKLLAAHAVEDQQAIRGARHVDPVAGGREHDRLRVAGDRDRDPVAVAVAVALGLVDHDRAVGGDRDEIAPEAQRLLALRAPRTRPAAGRSRGPPALGFSPARRATSIPPIVACSSRGEPWSLERKRTGVRRTIWVTRARRCPPRRGRRRDRRWRGAPARATAARAASPGRGRRRCASCRAGRRSPVRDRRPTVRWSGGSLSSSFQADGSSLGTR